MLPSYLFLRVTHLQQSLSSFMHNTLIEAAILIQVIPTYQPTSIVGNNQQQTMQETKTLMQTPVHCTHMQQQIIPTDSSVCVVQVCACRTL